MKTTCVQFVSPVTKFSWECVCLKIIVKTINVSTAWPQVFVPSVGAGSIFFPVDIVRTFILFLESLFHLQQVYLSFT